MPVDLKDWDLHHRPCELATLLNALTELQAKLPGALVGRSGHGTGNLCVYDQDGNYVGVVTLGSRPELDLFADDEAITGARELLDAMMAAEDLPTITYRRWMPGDE